MKKKEDQFIGFHLGIFIMQYIYLSIDITLKMINLNQIERELFFVKKIPLFVRVDVCVCSVGIIKIQKDE